MLVFQLVPQRFKKEIGVFDRPGRHGRRRRGFYLASSLGYAKQVTGSYQLGFRSPACRPGAGRADRGRQPLAYDLGAAHLTAARIEAGSSAYPERLDARGPRNRARLHSCPCGGPAGPPCSAGRFIPIRLPIETQKRAEDRAGAPKAKWIKDRSGKPIGIRTPSRITPCLYKSPSATPLTGPRERKRGLLRGRHVDGIDRENKGVLAAVADGIGGHLGWARGGRIHGARAFADYYATPRYPEHPRLWKR